MTLADSRTRPSPLAEALAGARCRHRRAARAGDARAATSSVASRRLPGLGDEVVARAVPPAPADADGMREAIVGPAARQGRALRVRGAGRRAGRARAEGGLPLLQFALAELWDARDGRSRVIPAAALAALGGVGRRARAPRRRRARAPAARRARGRAAACCCAGHRRGHARPPQRDRAAAGGDRAARAALEALVRGRLVVAREAQRRRRLRDRARGAARRLGDAARLARHDADGARWCAPALERAAAEWERLGRGREALWARRQLAEARALDPAALGAARARVRRRLGPARPGGGGASAARGGAAVLGGALVGARLQSRAQLARAGRDRASTRARSAAVRRARPAAAPSRGRAAARFACSTAARWPDGEAAWSRAQALAARGRAARIARAAAALEGALALDPGRAACARGSPTSRRAAAAAPSATPRDQRNELVRRLALYDADGIRRRRLEAPARLARHQRPAGRR